MRFFLVHELSCSNGAGRLRARACRPMTQVQAEILADTLDAIDGVEGVRVNPRVPSVLVLYRHAQARQDVLRSLAAQDAGALNDGSLLISLLSGGKDIDLQGLLIRRVAEEGQRLLLAVSVQILQLYGLDVAAGDGGRVLRPALQQLVE